MKLKITFIALVLIGLASATKTDASPTKGQLAYVSIQNKGQLQSTIWLYDFDTNSRKALFETVDESIGSLKWSPDGKYLLFITIPDQFRSRIHVIDALGKLIYKGRSDKEDHASWSWDSKHIAFDSYRQSSREIVTMNFDGTDQRQLTSDPYEDFMPTWSPDDKQITYWSRRDGPDGEIYVISALGLNRRRLTFDTMGNTSPIWSKDGKSIYFMSSEGISVIDITGGSQRLVTALNVNDRPVEGYEAAPILSPDGTKILFTRLGKGIFVVGGDGVNDHRLIDSVDASEPAWSPDGQYIAYDERFSVVMIVKNDGTDKQRISPETEEFDFSPAWKP